MGAALGGLQGDNVDDNCYHALMHVRKYNQHVKLVIFLSKNKLI